MQEQEAQYTYYNHGPLMNTVFGKMQVQKQDYVYTLQGWLKGINPVMGGTLANGKDTTDLSNYARDVYGFSLHYYNKNYRAIGTASASTTVLNAMGSGATQLYNGNIAAMAVTLSPFGGAGQGTRVYNYKYDQLNRLVAMDAHKGLYPAAGTLGTFTDTLLKDYQERVSYDPNGNILTYNRHGDAARLSMDSMTYSYLDTSNKLDKVVDLASDNPGYHDIRTGQANGNYKYDAIGNMTADVGDTVSNIKWTVYGKIASLVKSGDTIRYVYDATGNRILKQTHDDTTAYVRDATGNVLSVYTKQAGADTVVRAEADIYGSSRLGMATQHMAPDTSITTLQKNVGLGTKVIFTRGEKLFELNNHLGNVLATVSDRKIEVDSSGDGFVDFYRADVISASDYYPGGMLMQGRSLVGANGYRYSINGQEKSSEISPNNTTAEFWEYDSRVLRRWNVDPVLKVEESSYLCFSGNPIWLSDPSGDSTPVRNQIFDNHGQEIKSPTVINIGTNTINPQQFPGMKPLGNNKVLVTPGNFMAEFDPTSAAGSTNQVFTQVLGDVEGGNLYTWGHASPRLVAATPEFVRNNIIIGVNGVFQQINTPRALNIAFNRLAPGSPDPTNFVNPAKAASAVRNFSNILKNSNITSGINVTVGTAFDRGITWPGGNASALLQSRANRVVGLFASNGIKVVPILQYSTTINITANVVTRQRIIIGWNVTSQAMQRQVLRGTADPNSTQPVPGSLPSTIFQRNTGGKPPLVGTYTGVWQ